MARISTNALASGSVLLTAAFLSACNPQTSSFFHATGPGTGAAQMATALQDQIPASSVFSENVIGSTSPYTTAQPGTLLAGLCDPGSRIQIIQDAQLLANVDCSALGHWQYYIQSIPNGQTTTYSVTELNASGTTIASVTRTTRRDANPPRSGGSITLDGTNGTATPVVDWRSVRLSVPVASAFLSSGLYVKVSSDSACSNGAWSSYPVANSSPFFYNAVVPAQTPDLTKLTYGFQFKNLAGVVSDCMTFSFVYDTQAPLTPHIQATPPYVNQTHVTLSIAAKDSVAYALFGSKDQCWGASASAVNLPVQGTSATYDLGTGAADGIYPIFVRFKYPGDALSACGATQVALSRTPPTALAGAPTLGSIPFSTDLSPVISWIPASFQNPGTTGFAVPITSYLVKLFSVSASGTPASSTPVISGVSGGAVIQFATPSGSPSILSTSQTYAARIYSVDAAGNVSTSFAQTPSFRPRLCPSLSGAQGGYSDTDALVAINPTVDSNTAAFCVGRFETKTHKKTSSYLSCRTVGGHRHCTTKTSDSYYPAINASDPPTVGSTFGAAQTACTNLGLTVISNWQWQKVAQAAAQNFGNWMGIPVSSDSSIATEAALPHGRAGLPISAGAIALTSSNLAVPLTSPSSRTGLDHRALLLSGSNDVIYDLAGNAAEWVNATGADLQSAISILAGRKMTISTLPLVRGLPQILNRILGFAEPADVSSLQCRSLGCGLGVADLTSSTSPIASQDINLALQSQPLTSAQSAALSGKYAFVRGGAFDDSVRDAGIYATRVTNKSAKPADVGFRCVTP